jgi:hypothetical protein
MGEKKYKEDKGERTKRSSFTTSSYAGGEEKSN